MDLRSEINMEKLPEHVAIIMDGNGRWAKSKGKARVIGHREGVKSVREITEVAARLGIKYMTLYAFSTENWNRPKFEVNALMNLLVETLRKEVPTLNRNGIRLESIGDISALPKKSQNALKQAKEKTISNTKMSLIIALNYSGRDEMVRTVQNIATKVKDKVINVDEINADLISNHLDTKNFPDPELLIRTSGETRISNFLLWQIAYSEFYFTPVYWPAFRENEFYDAIIDFQQRERRFGKISEQL